MLRKSGSGYMKVPQALSIQRRSKRPSVRRYSINCIKKLLSEDEIDIHVFVNLFKSFGVDKPNYLLDILLHFLEGINYFKELLRLFDKKLLIYILCNGQLLCLQGKSVLHLNSPAFAIVLNGQIQTVATPSQIFRQGQIIKSGQLGCGNIICESETYAFLLEGDMLLKACSNEFAQIVEFIRFLQEYFFEGIKKMQLQDCWQYVLPFRIINYKPLEKIIQQGVALKGLYIIHSGQVIVQKNQQDNSFNKDSELQRSQSCHGFRRTKPPPANPHLIKSLTRGQFIGLAEVILFTSSGNVHSLNSEFSVVANSNVDLVMCPIDLVPQMLSNNHYLKSQLERRSKMYSIRTSKAPSSCAVEEVQQVSDIPETFSLMAFMKNAKKNTKSQISNIKKQFKYKPRKPNKENDNPLDYLFDQNYYSKKHKLKKQLKQIDVQAQSKDKEWLAYSMDSQTLKRMYSSNGFSRSTKGPVNFHIGFK